MFILLFINKFIISIIFIIEILKTNFIKPC